MRLILVALVISATSTPAFAYVDPGVMGMVFQFGYLIIFGALSLFILRPWNYMKGLVRSLFGRSEENDRTEDRSDP